MPKDGGFVKARKPSPAGATEAAVALAGLAFLVASGVLQGAWARGAPDAQAWWAAAGAAGILALAGLRGMGRHWARPGFLRSWTLAAFAALSLAVMLSQHTGVVRGRWHAWLEDDAMVSMQYARHLAAGQGLVWTPGQRVEGYSDPLWTLMMAGVLALGAPRAWASAPVLALNLFLGLAAILGVDRLARSLGASALAAALAAAGFGLSFELVWAAGSGMETVAMACLSAWAYAGLARARVDGSGPPAWVLVCAGALGLLRFDGLLPAALILALSWRLAGRRGRLVDAALALGPALVWQAFRLGYYGSWVPNTVALKSGEGLARLADGARYLLRLDWEERLALLAALSSLARPGLRVWGLCLVLGLLYALPTGGDFYPGTRYLAWVWPLPWALAAASLCGWLPARSAAAAMALAAVVSYQAFWAFPGLMRGGWRAARRRVSVAEGLARWVAPGQKVACAWAGSFYFFSDVAGVDLLGKCDPAVARARPDPALGPTAHDKLDLSESLLGRRPGWVLLVPPGQPGPEPWLHSAFDRRLWDFPPFVEHCRGEIRAVGGPWALCRCRWGPDRHSRGKLGHLRP